MSTNKPEIGHYFEFTNGGFLCAIYDSSKKVKVGLPLYGTCTARTTKASPWSAVEMPFSTSALSSFFLRFSENTKS
jgi:hypothetical protein